jgi:hypothetical protein
LCHLPVVIELSILRAVFGHWLSLGVGHGFCRRLQQVPEDFDWLSVVGRVPAAPIIRAAGDYTSVLMGEIAPGDWVYVASPDTEVYELTFLGSRYVTLPLLSEYGIDG